MLDIPWKSWKCVEIKIVQLYQDQSKVFCESFISSKFQIFSLIKIDSVCQSVCPASQPCKVGVTSRDVLVHNYERKSYLLISGNIKNKGSGFRKKNIRAKKSIWKIDFLGTFSHDLLSQSHIFCSPVLATSFPYHDMLPTGTV